jgi:hypothetical protein
MYFSEYSDPQGQGFILAHGKMALKDGVVVVVI